MLDALKSLNLSNKTDELKQMDGIFPKTFLNDLIIHKLKRIIQLKKLLNQISWIINQSVEELKFSVSIHYLLPFKRYIRKKISIRRSWQ